MLFFTPSLITQQKRGKPHTFYSITKIIDNFKEKNVKDAKGLDNQISQKNNEKQKILAQKNTITKEYENNSQKPLMMN